MGHGRGLQEEGSLALKNGLSERSDTDQGGWQQPCCRESIGGEGPGPLLLLCPLVPSLQALHPDAQGIEIVFVSSDQTPEDMNSYMKEAHGDWMAVEHDSDVSNKLSQKYGVSGIPCLVVVKKDGTLVTKEGRSGVTSMAPAQAVASWKK